MSCSRLHCCLFTMSCCDKIGGIHESSTTAQVVRYSNLMCQINWIVILCSHCSLLWTCKPLMRHSTRLLDRWPTSPLWTWWKAIPHQMLWFVAFTVHQLQPHFQLTGLQLTFDLQLCIVNMAYFHYTAWWNKDYFKHNVAITGPGPSSDLGHSVKWLAGNSQWIYYREQQESLKETEGEEIIDIQILTTIKLHCILLHLGLFWGTSHILYYRKCPYNTNRLSWHQFNPSDSLSVQGSSLDHSQLWVHPVFRSSSTSADIETVLALEENSVWVCEYTWPTPWPQW